MKSALLIFLATFIVYYIFSPGETSYNYFTRLSQSFINGKLYLSQNPSWLNELIPVESKYYVVYPPMPSVILMPFVLIFGENYQTLFSIILGSVNVALIFLLCKKLSLSNKTVLLVTIFFGFGTNHFYLASVGSAWFLAHIVALFILILSLIETFGQRRLWLIGLLIGASFWSRSTVIFTLPFFYIFLYKHFWPLNKHSFSSNKNAIKNFLIFNSGMIFFLLLDGIYNFVRFGNFSLFAPYQLIPNLNNDPMFKNGFMSINFIPRHLDAIFLRLPKFQEIFPYVVPSLYSMAIWFTSPALFLIFKAKKTLLTIACWIPIITTLFVIMLWAGVGYAQFGYRFLQDVMPFLLILMAFGIGQNPSTLSYLLVFLSILINLWGVLMINIFNIWVI